jgi:DNA-binding MarR family transcriptional regulator
MDNKDLRTLALFEAIENADSPQSQRDLAGTLNISLGLVNAFLKRLVKKGYFKITHLPRNRIGYILTPKGASEKTRLTYAYLHYSLRFYRETLIKFKELFRDLTENGVGKILFYGVSELAEIGHVFLEESDLHLIAIIDDRQKGTHKCGVVVLGLDAIHQLTYDRILITDPDEPILSVNTLVSAGVDERHIVLL